MPIPNSAPASKPAPPIKPGSSPSPTTAPTSRAGRCSPAFGRSRASSSRRLAASPANRPCLKAPAAPTPASTRSRRLQASHFVPPFRPKICSAPSIAPFPHRSASPKPEPCEAPFMRAIQPSPKLTNTVSFAQQILRLSCARPSLPATSTPVRGRCLSTRSKLARASLKASTTSSASPQPIPTSRTANLIPLKPKSKTQKRPRCRWSRPSRTIFSSAWEQRPTADGDLLVYRIRGNGFLHHMVRNLVGTMIDVARGQLALAEIPRILAARRRSEAGPTAPARGLFLHSVDYPPEP